MIILAIKHACDYENDIEKWKLIIDELYLYMCFNLIWFYFYMEYTVKWMLPIKKVNVEV